MLRHHSTQAGVAGKTTAIFGDPKTQNQDAYRLTQLAAQVAGNFPQVNLIAYYELFGISKPTPDFDSGLVELPYPDTTSDGKALNPPNNQANPATLFRTAYCLLAKRPLWDQLNRPCAGANAH